jgi:hypothetical protein
MSTRNPEDWFAELKFWAIIATLLVLEAGYIILLFLWITRFVERCRFSAVAVALVAAVALFLIALKDVHCRDRR